MSVLVQKSPRACTRAKHGHSTGHTHPTVIQADINAQWYPITRQCSSASSREGFNDATSVELRGTNSAQGKMRSWEGAPSRARNEMWHAPNNKTIQVVVIGLSGGKDHGAFDRSR